MHQQSPQGVVVGPFLEVAWQAQRGPMVRCIGAAQVALRQHVQQPPGQTIAMDLKSLGLGEHKTIGPNGCQNAQLVEFALGIHAKHRHIAKAAPCIA